ncbi:polysaccharide biosynthesis/export family protein [Novosphingobium sp. SG707]|uniref:polysaccharide biosynthesis/export family protein n=1 Tax=Novosphingobium sp. SG707 TaxID=2586996 RepID=UPI001445335F|nr:polysaccharide biosynthesis/export family protein [Novosphingobium sp. SG707]NKJ02477.1 polysaccharide export outer membrane protein [Novosphingobium sp. SG707]
MRRNSNRPRAKIAIALAIGTSLLWQAPTHAETSLPQSASLQDYHLGPNDRISLSVYGEDEISREYVISPTGMISVPLIGEVEAKGLTVEQLRGEIQRRLAAGFVNNPTISLMITGYRNFYILGEVGRPGEYAYTVGLTVTQAVAEAAGFTYRAAKRYVYIRHEGETEEKKVQLSPDMKVLPGDTIRFGERYF